MRCGWRRLRAMSEFGTVEFLVEVDERGASTGRHIFIELNPRLQVEHTVTEEVLNVDIVRAQLQIARGLSLDEIGLRDAARRGPVGFAMQMRINTEVFAPDGSLRAASGTIAAFNPSSGKGVRVETAGYAGATISSRIRCAAGEACRLRSRPVVPGIDGPRLPGAVRIPG